ncbi:CpsD/CapB family tyrosine-protein kinase [Sphingomonas corticis]|jgi:capsular exopolysaccharide synthesis family protein|uniref:CpsD/CapB family tyrosine-protein kinase n=1 Tax=Sphingomonas corticis TaxID=2722791 RepID=A0ABX1CIM6_9SPHN|nr:CpsD/CapB family tyrosine-protein kinase [Sphingomonas corticis]NJR77847.1 CpsD/CapB family tyrosine-protein kinase [Sphingomonas corticis]
MATTTATAVPPVAAREGAPVQRATTFQVSADVHLLSEPTGARAESVRVLRTHLIAQHLRDGRRSLAVCAPAVGAGCSYIAANLAVGLAQTGVKTLLIDGNMRGPGLENYFRPSAGAPGLYDCLSRDDLAVREAIHEDVVPGLSLLFAGQAAPEAQELLGAAGFKALVDACVRDYDLTLIDTPPANSYADARRIASVMRYAMVVARRDKSYVRDVRTLIDELTSDRVRVVGTYLNDI